jgi:transcriptional regulator
VPKCHAFCKEQSARQFGTSLNQALGGTKTYMYTPPHFEEASASTMRALICAHPLAALVTQGTDGISADHIPMLPVGATSLFALHGHVARANPLWRNLSEDSDVLAIFQGPNQYISPKWYPSKQEHGKVVPTWNYLVVHARGRIRWKHEAGWLREHIEVATSTHEDADNPWQVSDAPDEFIDRMLSAIIGFEIQISELKGKWKLNQNRSAADKRGVIDGLKNQGSSVAAEMAAWMESEGGGA